MFRGRGAANIPSETIFADANKCIAKQILDSVNTYAIAGIFCAQDSFLSQRLHQLVLIHRPIALRIRIEQRRHFEFLRMKNRREIGDPRGAVGWQQLNALVKIDNSSIAQHLRDGLDVPKVGQTLEEQVTVLRKQTLGKIVTER